MIHHLTEQDYYPLVSPLLVGVCGYPWLLSSAQTSSQTTTDHSTLQQQLSESQAGRDCNDTGSNLSTVMVGDPVLRLVDQWDRTASAVH